MSRDAQMTEEGKQEWMALDRDVFNSWCIIGQNLCLSSHSQIAAFLVDSYKNKVEPGVVCCVQCGSSLSWVCVSCHAQPTPEQQKQLCRQGHSAHIAIQNDVKRHSIQDDADQKQKRQQHLKKQHQQTPQQLKKKRILQKQTEQRHHLQQEDQDQHSQQHQDKQHQYHQQPQDQEQQHHFQQQDQDQQQQHHQQDQNQQQQHQHQQHHQQLCVGSEKTTDKKGQKRQSLEEEGISFCSDSVREGEPIICIKTENNADLPAFGKSQRKGEEPDNSHASSSPFPLAFKVDLETPHQVSNSELSSCNTSTRARKRKGKFRVDLETSCCQGSNKAGDGDFSSCTTGKRKYKGKFRVDLKETPLQVSHCDSVVDCFSSCNANTRKGKHEGMVTVDLDETPYQGSDRDSDGELSSCNNNAGTGKQKHERRLSQDGILKCEACSKTFATVKYLKRHQLIHKGVKPYMCHVCGRGFTYSTYLKNHMLVHSDHRAYRCSTCGKSFTRTSQLKRHARIHTGEKPHVCGVCAAAFCQAGNLKQHLLTHTGEKPYVCDMCGTGFAQVGTLKQHKLVHAGQKDHACQACGKAFYTAAKLNYHVKHEHEEGAGGDEGAVTTATEARPKKFVCEECGSSATSAGNLKKHKALHSSEKLVCDVCCKTFSFACNLKTHKLTHYGEKKVACAVCSKAFYTQGDLTRHMLVHSGERKHCCDVCWRSFSQLSNLKQHKIKVHKLLPPVSSVKSKKEDET